VLLESEERRGQEGKAHEAWLDLEPEDGISIAEDVEYEVELGADGEIEKYMLIFSSSRILSVSKTS